MVSIHNLTNLLKSNFKFLIIAPACDLGEKYILDGIKLGEWNNKNDKDVLYVLNNQNKYSYIKKMVLQKGRPDLIYVNSIFNIKNMLNGILLARSFGVSILIAPRGELGSGALSIKKWKKLPYIILLRFTLMKFTSTYFQGTSNQEVDEIKKYFKCAPDKVHKLENITITQPSKIAIRNKSHNSLNLVFISRIQTKKNLKYAIQVLTGVSSKYDINFHIYGPIENSKYWQECKEEIKKLPANIKCTYDGTLSGKDVISTFAKYDAFLFPTMNENFGHVIAESLSVGTPVILSDQTPWNSINSTLAGFALHLSDRDSFAKCIQTLADEDKVSFHERRIAAVKFFQANTDTEGTLLRYINILMAIIKG